MDYSLWNSPGQNTGVGSLSLLQGIFPNQGLNPGLLHCWRIFYQLSHKGSPRIPECCLSLLQWIFLTQELNQGLLHCRQILYQLSSQGSPLDIYIGLNSWVWETWRFYSQLAWGLCGQVLIIMEWYGSGKFPVVHISVSEKRSWAMTVTVWKNFGSRLKWNKRIDSEAVVTSWHCVLEVLLFQ